MDRGNRKSVEIEDRERGHSERKRQRKSINDRGHVTEIQKIRKLRKTERFTTENC